MSFRELISLFINPYRNDSLDLCEIIVPLRYRLPWLLSKYLKENKFAFDRCLLVSTHLLKRIEILFIPFKGLKFRIYRTVTHGNTLTHGSNFLFCSNVRNFTALKHSLSFLLLLNCNRNIFVIFSDNFRIFAQSAPVGIKQKTKSLKRRFYVN